MEESPFGDLPFDPSLLPLELVESLVLVSEMNEQPDGLFTRSMILNKEISE